MREDILGLTLESAREKLKNEKFRIVKIDGKNSQK